MRANTEADFWAKVDKGGPPHPTLGTPCWPWMAGKDQDGYGQFNWHNKLRRSHRMAAEFVGMAPPAEMMVCHHCDNPPCCNPAHLYIGTCKKNFEDMYARGRGPTGDRNGSRRYPERRKRGTLCALSKLNDDKVRDIRRLHASGMMATEIAPQFGTTPENVGFIVRGRTWRHVT